MIELTHYRSFIIDKSIKTLSGAYMYVCRQSHNLVAIHTFPLQKGIVFIFFFFSLDLSSCTLNILIMVSIPCKCALNYPVSFTFHDNCMHCKPTPPSRNREGTAMPS